MNRQNQLAHATGIELSREKGLFRNQRKGKSTTYQEDKKGMGFAWLLGRNWLAPASIALVQPISLARLGRGFSSSSSRSCFLITEECSQ